MSINKMSNISFTAAYALKLQPGENSSSRAKELRGMISALQGIPKGLKDEFTYSVTTNDVNPHENIETANVFLLTKKDADQKEVIRDTTLSKGFKAFIDAIVDYVKSKNGIIEIDKNKPLSSQIFVSYENGDVKLNKKA